MAMLQAQKYRILRYLGWPMRTVDPGSASYSSYIDQQLTSFPDDALPELDDVLSKLDDIETQRQVMITRTNVQQVDDITFFQDGSADLRRERARLVKELAAILDVAPYGGGSMGQVCI